MDIREINIIRKHYASTVAALNEAEAAYNRDYGHSRVKREAYQFAAAKEQALSDLCVDLGVALRGDDLKLLPAEAEPSHVYAGKNTRISYVYCDGSNYKQYNSEVVAGNISPEQRYTISNCLDSREYFIPAQVGLPEIRFPFRTEDDCAWFSLSEYDFEDTDDAPTVQVTAQELYEKFLDAGQNGWDCSLWEEEPAQHKCEFCGCLLTEGTDKIHKGFFRSAERCWCEKCDAKMFAK